jgi:hypothetical protein
MGATTIGTGDSGAVAPDGAGDAEGMLLRREPAADEPLEAGIDSAVGAPVDPHPEARMATTASPVILARTE